MSQIPRLSRKEMVILQLLAAGGPDYGLGLVSASHGALKRGTIYVTLSRMEDKGYLTSYKEDLAKDTPRASGPPRRIYQPTNYGVRVLRAFEALRSTLLAPAESSPRMLSPQVVGADQ